MAYLWQDVAINIVSFPTSFVSFYWLLNSDKTVFTASSSNRLILCRAKSNWLFDVPWGIRKLLNWVSKEYGQPDIVVTENGWSDDGSSLVDDSRIKYYSGYITEMSKGNSL